jgi:glutathione synthase/RimK-type ligase-like ATP-grasp enzyme
MIAIAGFADRVPAGDFALVEALEQLGHTAELAVWNDPAVAWARYDSVVIRSCWDYHLQTERFLRWLSSLEAPVVNSTTLIRWNIDKRYLRQLKVALPETVWLEGKDSVDVSQICAARNWSAAVVKPFISGGAYKTEIMLEGLANGPAIVQEYLPSIEAGEWSLMYFGGVYSHAVLKKPASGDFRVQLHFGGSETPAEPPSEVRKFGETVMANLPEPAPLARVDIVMCPRRGPLLMELEVIEPELFLSTSQGSAAKAAKAILDFLG